MMCLWRRGCAPRRLLKGKPSAARCMMRQCVRAAPRRTNNMHARGFHKKTGLFLLCARVEKARCSALSSQVCNAHWAGQRLAFLGEITSGLYNCIAAYRLTVHYTETLTKQGNSFKEFQICQIELHFINRAYLL